MKKEKIKGILKYIVRILTYTFLTIIIIIGLFLLYVFVSAKISKSKGKEAPVNLYTIISPSMTPNINVYDVVVALKTDPSKLKTSDIISFYTDELNTKGLTITHRIIQTSSSEEGYLFKTKGDYNSSADTWIVKEKDIVGKVVFKIPKLGKVQFFLGSKGGWLIAILIPALAIIAYDIYKIIKLILIKQKIIAYQKEQETSESSIGTISDIYKEDVKVNEEISNSKEVEVNSDISIKEKITEINNIIPEEIELKSNDKILEENNIEDNPKTDVEVSNGNEIEINNIIPEETQPKSNDKILEEDIKEDDLKTEIEEIVIIEEK